MNIYIYIYMYIVIYVYVYLQKASHTATPRYPAVTGSSSTPLRAICALERIIYMNIGICSYLYINIDVHLYEYTYRYIYI